MVSLINSLSKNPLNLKKRPQTGPRGEAAVTLALIVSRSWAATHFKDFGVKGSF